MIQNIEKKNCCGCTACESVCPRGCIAMVSDEEGFVYPKVNIDSCVNCGLCEKVCPVLSKPMSNQDLSICKTYVGFIRDSEIRLNSSSGGVFSAFAHYVIDKGGIVFGAAYDQNFDVKHTRAETVQELVKLRGSKYSQSNLQGIYKDVVAELKKGRLVLFTGTACQISGLKGFLKKEYENLITIDILCHGVPSPKIWRRYLDEIEKGNGKIKDINLRCKSTGWYNYSTQVKLNSGKIIEHSHFEDPFMQLFLGDICLRPSCHDCKFKNINRDSDVTIGDSWGIDRIDNDYRDDRGTSVIVLHTEKGERIFSEIENAFCYTSYDLETVLPSNSKSRIFAEPHVNRSKLFMLSLENRSMEDMTRLLSLSFWAKLKRKLYHLIKV